MPLWENLVLVGARGSGKTTIGRRVAQSVGVAFVDADLELERRAGRSVSEVFAHEGEPVFRDLEEATIAALVRDSQGVLATGGGAVLRASNRDALRSHGLVVWLVATPKSLRERIEASGPRPSLTGRSTLDEVEDVLLARRALYEATAHVLIETDGLGPAEVEGAVRAAWGR